MADAATSPRCDNRWPSTRPCPAALARYKQSGENKIRRSGRPGPARRNKSSARRRPAALACIQTKSSRNGEALSSWLAIEPAGGGTVARSNDGDVGGQLLPPASPRQ